MWMNITNCTIQVDKSNSHRNDFQKASQSTIAGISVENLYYFYIFKSNHPDN